jgi:hypothetical protein
MWTQRTATTAAREKERAWTQTGKSSGENRADSAYIQLANVRPITGEPKKGKGEKMEEKRPLIDNKQVSVKTIDSRARHPRFSISFSLLLPNIMGTCRKMYEGNKSLEGSHQILTDALRYFPAFSQLLHRWHCRAERDQCIDYLSA